MPILKQRKQLPAQMQYLEIMKELYDLGAYDPETGWDREVIVNYCNNTLLPRLLEEEENFYGEFTEKESIAYINKRKPELTPKRWQDTAKVFRKDIALIVAGYRPENYRVITLWLGDDLLEKSVSGNRPLAALLLKRLRGNIQRSFPAAKFGCSINLESAEIAGEGVHVHGVIFSSDSSLFKPNAKGKNFRNEIINAAGRTHKKDKSRILLFQPTDMSLKHMRYQRKSQRPTLKPMTLSSGGNSKRIPILQKYGHKVDAVSADLVGELKKFYIPSRLLVIGLISGDVVNWTEQQWRDVDIREV